MKMLRNRNEMARRRSSEPLIHNIKRTTRTYFLPSLFLLTIYNLSKSIKILQDYETVAIAFKKREVSCPPQRVMDLWKGQRKSTPLDPFDEKHQLSFNSKDVRIIEIAVAYCKMDLGWLKEEIRYDFPKETEIKITILSKCGMEDKLPNFMEASKAVVSQEVLKLNNVGGCDYAYIHFINEYLKRETSGSASSSIIFFVKDTPRNKGALHQPGSFRPLSEILSLASHGEFSCGLKPPPETSVYHDPALLSRFYLKNYVRNGKEQKSIAERVKRAQEIASGSAPEGFNTANYTNLGNFVERELQSWKFPNDDATEVCYGGVFAIPGSNLYQYEGLLGLIFTRLEEIASESTMSVVEHFLERLYASLLSNPLDEEETELVLSQATEIIKKEKSFMGTFKNMRMKTCKYHSS